MITNIQITDIFRIILGSLVLSLLLAYVSIRVAPKLKLIDFPGSADHKLHQKPMPLTGGLVLVLTLSGILFFAPGKIDSDIMSLLAASWIILTFGLWDDYHHLPVGWKLLGQLLAALLLVFLDVKVRIFTSPEFILGSQTILGEGLNILTTLVWMIVLTNAFNLIDSMDGLAAGLGSLATLFFLVITLSVSQMELVHFCAILLGAIAGIYFFNSHPARLFLGDSGAQTIGFLLGAIAILYTPVGGNQSSSWFVPILIFAIPLFDLFLVLISRMRRGEKIHKASRDHTYHRLAALGIPIERSVLLMHGSSLILSLVGYLCLNLNYVIANVIFLIVLLAGLFIFLYLENYYQAPISEIKE
ncbi:MAG: MraY family glycosyltransferase [Fidelibacterota bacterium]